MLCERANALIRLGDLAAHDAAYRALVASREAEDRDTVLDALNLATVAEIHAGRLREALRNAEEAVSMLADQRTVDGVDAVGLLAWVVALLGDEPRCLALIDDADRRLAELRITAPGGLARGLLALSMGRTAEAVAAFESKAAEARLGPGAAMTWLRPFGAEFVEAYVRAGRSDDARRLLAEISPVAMATGQPRLAAPVWRATGLVNDDEDAFETALTEHHRWGNRFEEARTRQVYGEFLRRRKRRAEARDQLGAAAATFEQLGALAQRDRAVAELRLAGERTPTSRAFKPAGPEALTRQEGEVVELVRGGLSNREIATRTGPQRENHRGAPDHDLRQVRRRVADAVGRSSDTGRGPSSSSGAHRALRSVRILRGMLGPESSTDAPGPLDIRAEAQRLTAAAAKANLGMRLMGGLAIWMVAPSARVAPFARDYADLDFAVRKRDGRAVTPFWMARVMWRSGCSTRSTGRSG